MKFKTLKSTIDVVTTTKDVVEATKDYKSNKVVAGVDLIFEGLFKGIAYLLKGVFKVVVFAIKNSHTETKKPKNPALVYNTPIENYKAIGVYED